MGNGSFDLQSVPTSRWLAGGGALVLLISLFLEWFGDDGYSQTGWSAFDGDKLVAAFAVIALVLVGIDLFELDVALPFDPALALIGCGGLSLFVVLLRFLDLSHFGIGIYLAFVASLALVGGGVLEWRDPAR